MSSEAPSTAPARPRKPRFDVEVRRVEHLTPRMVRVTFTGPALRDFAWNGPAAHIKLIFSDLARPGAGEEPPEATAGRTVMRTYTPRRFDPRVPELDVELVIHGEGPASAWAAQAAVGQRLTIAGPGRSYTVDPAADWYLLVGDETAIPALGTVLEALPVALPTIALVEVADAAERHAIAHGGPQARIDWLVRDAEAHGAGERLEPAVRELAWPAGSGRVYVACEAGVMRRIRRHLLQERGMPREHVVTRGYWRIGATDHPDRDYGEDVG